MMRWKTVFYDTEHTWVELRLSSSHTHTHTEIWSSSHHVDLQYNSVENFSPIIIMIIISLHLHRLGRFGDLYHTWSAQYQRTASRGQENAQVSHLILITGRLSLNKFKIQTLMLNVFFNVKLLSSSSLFLSLGFIVIKSFIILTVKWFPKRLHIFCWNLVFLGFIVHGSVYVGAL